ncbi:hypothetical protein BJX64DRAFT_70992 [Aspergillus heterothallicus]
MMGSITRNDYCANAKVSVQSRSPHQEIWKETGYVSSTLFATSLRNLVSPRSRTGQRGLEDPSTLSYRQRLQRHRSPTMGCAPVMWHYQRQGPANDRQIITSRSLFERNTALLCNDSLP